MDVLLPFKSSLVVIR